ncbi:hypothetical protein DZD18_08460 [Rhodobacteraceae bacterium W635]|uniref:head-tail connector protein n=1 Tax=Nioella halotolerans TaxID=2303578 RepID=UPI000E3D666D|nr:hypothetical protein DZD18_08460 [Rhodobacteraceae bacterium W635]
MMMVEMSSVSSALLPITELTDHLRLASGFADDGSQDAQLESCLRAALAAIEARIGKALFQRGFSWHLSHWQSPQEQVLPVAPVAMIDSVKLVSRAGVETQLDPDSYSLRLDAHRPAIVAVSKLPSPSSGGSIEMEFTAGFGADWHGVPADLRQAVLLQAAEYYDAQGTGGAGMACGVAVLIEPYRSVRMRGLG